MRLANPLSERAAADADLAARHPAGRCCAATSPRPARRRRSSSSVWSRRRPSEPAAAPSPGIESPPRRRDPRPPSSGRCRRSRAARHRGWPATASRRGWWGPGRPADWCDAVAWALDGRPARWVWTLVVSADAARAVAPGPLRPAGPGRRHPGRPRRRAAPDGHRGARPARAHLRGRARPRRAGRGPGAPLEARALSTYPLALRTSRSWSTRRAGGRRWRRRCARAAASLESVGCSTSTAGPGRWGAQVAGLPAGFRAADRTLTTDEASALRDAAVAEAAERTGAVQR